MPIRVYKPTSAGRRNASVNMHSEVTKHRPEKSLTAPKPKKGGRNHHGFITARGRGGGAKQLYRKIDFRRRDRDGIEGKIAAIEYDPNRTCHIMLVEYSDGVKRYHLAPDKVKVGQTIESSREKAVEPTAGSAMCLRYIPAGMNVHCVELQPGRGGQMCRSAGTYARLTNKEDDYATLVMPSGEIRRVLLDCMATVGQVGNSDHQNRVLGKAGMSRHMGRRPITRGVARNHHDHPLGGGDGKSKGNRSPASKSGVFSKGGPTRNPNKASKKLIIRRRKSTRYGVIDR
ncbi:MAG: 50S ribosomal protein L2 [Phycisphaeraceae bacterium]|nr:50S ribosomal protein L2 [Phycisphaerales bacterium]MCB9860277.1 50S ribosomal protein L2 [Phycisphaeraceae bacterium]